MKTFLNFTFILILTISTQAYSGGFSALGIGFKRSAMFATIANPDEVSAIYHNPAGLLNLHGTQFNFFNRLVIMDIGLRLYDSNYNLHPDYNIKPSRFLATSPFLGMSSDLGTDRLRIGFAIYFPNALGAFLPEDEPTKYQLIDAYMVAGFATFAAAYKLTPKFYLSAGVSMIYALMAGSQIMNLAVLQNPDLRFYPEEGQEQGDMKLNMTSQAITWGWTVGIILKPIKNFDIGFAYTSGASLNFKGSLTLKTTDGSSLKSNMRSPMVIPFSLRGGIAWRFYPGWELGIDINYWHYQVFQTKIMYLDPAPISGMEELKTPKNYTNSINFGIGIMYKINDKFTMTAGFQYDDSPIPTKTLSLDTPARNYFGHTLGLRYYITHSFRIGVTFAINWFEKINVTNSILNPPVNSKGAGHSTEIGVGLNYAL